MELLFIISAFNGLLTLAEMAIDWLLKRPRRWKDTGANVLIYLIGSMLENTLYGAILLICLLPWQYITPLSISEVWWSWPLALIAADFSYYWMHRIEHEHRILWASHSVHHSSEDYNLSIGLRLSLTDSLTEWIFLVPMILLGFSPFQTVIAIALVTQYQHWIHTQYIGKLGWLDEVFNTPSAHRVHHGSNPEYLDKNYGGVLIIWDKLFGTYAREEAPVVYGLTKNIDTNNPLKILFIEYYHIWQDWRKAKGWRACWRVVFGPLSKPPAG